MVETNFDKLIIYFGRHSFSFGIQEVSFRRAQSVVKMVHGPTDFETTLYILLYAFLNRNLTEAHTPEARFINHLPADGIPVIVFVSLSVSLYHVLRRSIW